MLHMFYEAKEMFGQRQNSLLACRQSHVRCDWQVIAEALGFLKAECAKGRGVMSDAGECDVGSL